MSIGPEVRQYFAKHAGRYDELVGSLAFQLTDAYSYLACYLARQLSQERRPRVLELGIGTGALTRHLLMACEALCVTGIDASPEMLRQARHNLHGYEERLSLVCGEFPDAIPEAEYDCVVSGMALSFYGIDHAALFRRVHRALISGGCFAYAANVTQNASSVENVIAKMLGDRVSLSREQWEFLRQIRGKLRIFEPPIDWHTAQLRQTGFLDVDCIYLRYKLGIFAGIRPRVAL